MKTAIHMKQDMDTKRRFVLYFMLMNVLILCSITVYYRSFDNWIFGIAKTYQPFFKKPNKVTTLKKPTIEKECKLTFTKQSMNKTNNLTVTKHATLAHLNVEASDKGQSLNNTLSPHNINKSM